LSKSHGGTPTPFCLWGGGGRWMCYFPIPFSRSCLSDYNKENENWDRAENKTNNYLSYCDYNYTERWKFRGTPVCRGTPVAHHRYIAKVSYTFQANAQIVPSNWLWLLPPLPFLFFMHIIILSHSKLNNICNSYSILKQLPISNIFCFYSCTYSVRGFWAPGPW
jgi:hypothetical protein